MKDNNNKQKGWQERILNNHKIRNLDVVATLIDNWNKKIRILYL